MMNYCFDPHARQELKDAVLYFNKINTALGSSFASEVERTIARILRFPEAWPLVTRSARRCRMRRFPYGIVYRLREKEIEIISIMHLSRRPDYWAERLK
jgi:plasmid stabilization system protein ParE